MKNKPKIKEEEKTIGKITVKRYIPGTLAIVEQLICSAGNKMTKKAQEILEHGEIGTGSTAPANDDKGLETGTHRKAVTLASVSNNVVTLQFFFADAELPNNTYYEFGTFVDGIITLGTGQIFNRGLFSPAYVKATSEDTTVEVEFTNN